MHVLGQRIDNGGNEHERGDQPGEGELGFEPFGLSGRGDEIGRRRLAGRQGRGQRVAAGKRGSHGHRRTGTPARIGMEAAHDDALGGRVEILAPTVLMPAGAARSCICISSISERGFEGALAGEDLVEHEAERVDIAR